MGDGPFRDLRLVELCTGVAGPLAGMLLGDLGADVVKLELPPGDAERGSPAFHVLNRSKRSVAIDGASDAARLAARADVLLVDREIARALGDELGAASLAAVAPRLVHCSVSGFGEEGPLADLPADDGLAAAAAAVSLLQWSHSGGPIYLRTPVTAYACGMMTALAIAAALHARAAGIAAGGQAIATSQLAAAMLFQSGTYVVGERHGGSIVQLANDPRGALPSYGFYRASDDWLFVGALTDAFWTKLCTAIERMDLLAHPDLQVTPMAFVTPLRRPIVRAALEAVFATRPRQAWLELLAEHDVPCAPVLDRAAFLRDEPTRAAGMVAPVVDPELGATVQPGVALRFAGAPGRIQRPAPRFDEHGDEVRREWGERTGPRSSVAPRGARASAASLRSWSDDCDHPRNIARASLRPAPLDGVRVVSLATFIAGALCPMLLADLGAEVIKLEPLDGDPFRVGTTYGFLGWNRGTRSLALDLRRPEGRELFLELVARADALVDNYRPGVLTRLGLDGATLRAANPRLVHTSITGFGTEGPLAARPCFDPILQARSGLVRAQGGEEPVFHQIAYTDYSTATLAAFGTASALFARASHAAPAERKGERVEASLLASGFVMQAGFLIDYPGRPADPPGGPALRGTGPFHRAYEVRDGWIFVAAAKEEERARLCAALAIDLPRPNEAAGASANEIEARLAARFAPLGRAESLALLRERSVPAVACAGFPEIVGDEHLRANRLWWGGSHSELGEIVQTGEVMQLSETPMRLGPTAPRLGEHTAELLRELDVGEERIAALLERGVARG